MPEITTEDLLYGYMNGIFPMAEPDGTIYWYSPDPRAIIPIDSYKPSKSLRPVINKKLFEVRVNSDFEGVMRGCAGIRILGKEESEESTWISEDIIEAYVALHKMGYAHSVEAWRENELVGGLYGVSINSVFFGESMFSKESNSSKVAFHYLIQILQANDFKLLDTQFMNDNVLRYGAIEIPRDDYMKRLQKGLAAKRKFNGRALVQ
ncbi:leucyl/phenylalanyl-tRNA--protein transferase [Dyadobacter sp. CY312]|uniref:leucyl/phenylalanyl-tRNA--protein transferase n=1 Tax=Dyadobacter sp. CY312 TaxID=2907303 RepID=UPI001F3A604B|nr:leucyl/phenylalanyl-tRNA--protein transferase [Dyadobacter sp. CY312]MCE7041165.1 leucyl/phenylalanyl-tRNA--protein transferase [Dyadobacter sp. CY312]